MNARTGPRPGGRSARVQEAVHRATRELADSIGRDALTVPLVAARAGVTPSTIYRRWGDLAALLADVSLQRMRPEDEPADTGSLQGDLLAWAEQYNEEMSSAVGRRMLSDVLAAGHPGGSGCNQCSAFVQSQITVLVERAVARGEPAVPVARVMDRLVAPLIYRLLFGQVPATSAELQDWIEASTALAA